MKEGEKDQGSHSDRVAEASRRARERYAEVLDRPGNLEPEDCESEDDLAIWRYAACKVRDSVTGGEKWEIRELYPDNEGFSCTEGPVEAQGASLEALRRDLLNMLADSRLSYLDLTGGHPRLVSQRE
ncbi:hypothetical protein GCM10009691_41520 [Brevibacterium picturae]|uniref:Uncharacterized protein n=1 Tax=Brevibacterium picturae TaxID=260553 RepID=A0ABP4NND8_9MICO